MLKRFSFLFTLLISVISVAQKNTHSPYSTFGVGELKDVDYTSYYGMGGVSLAASDSGVVNHSNPASYSYIGRYRPVLQVGLDGRLSNFETATSSSNQRFFSLNQFQFGIPIKKNWGAAIGLKPYSFSGYLISNYVVEDGDTTSLFTNEGKGGISKFFLGVGYSPINMKKSVYRNIAYQDTTGKTINDSLKVTYTNRLSLGANASYLFGSAERIKSYQYVSSLFGRNAKVDNALRFADFIYEFGLNYEFGWRSSRSNGSKTKANAIAIGATFSPSIRIKAFQDLYSYSYLNFGGFNGAEVDIDTVEYVRDNQGAVVLPESYNVGLEYRIGPKGVENSSVFRVAADLRYQKWSNYSEDFGEEYTDNLKDRMRMSMGIEYTPIAMPAARDPFFGKLKYRIGGYYTMTELSVLNSANNYTDLTAYGMSFGIGIPVTIVRNSNTNINFGANLGSMGTTEQGLIREKFIGLSFGVSITPGNGNYWFLKRKYD